MISLISLLYTFLLISCVLFLLNFLISKKPQINSREKMSPFECGFDPVAMNRLPFSIQFFLISLIFLIFDVEISLLIPLILLMNFKISIEMILVGILFLWILTIGLFIEYSEKSIDWKM